MSRSALDAAIVVGGGQVALLAAIAIARTSPRTQVTIVETPIAATALADSAHTTLSSLGRLHQRLGITDVGMLRRAAATHRLATDYAGFGPSPFTIAFGAVPAAMFAGTDSAVGDEPIRTLGADLAVTERFAAPSDDAADPLADLDYALRFDPRAHAVHLASLARHIGIAFVTDPLDVVEFDAVGDVAALRLVTGQRLDAPLFINAAGAATPLRRGHFVSWVDRLLADRLLDAAPLPPTISLRDRAGAVAAGYMLHSPGRDASRLTLAWRRTLLSDDEAIALLRRAGGEPMRIVEIEPGRVADAWNGNVIALGDAAATLEPLAATNLHLAVRHIELLMELFPSAPLRSSERVEYNRRAALLAETTADFVAAHHAARDLPRSAELARTLDLYDRRGHLARWTEDSVSRDLWQQLLGGVVGSRVDAPARGLPRATRTALAAAAQDRIARGVATARPYPAWLAERLSQPA